MNTWKRLIAAVVGIVTAFFTGLIVMGIAAFFPLFGLVVEAIFLGGLVLIIAALIYEFGEAACKKLFGWFY